jgi:hypothetical protein
MRRSPLQRRTPIKKISTTRRRTCRNPECKARFAVAEWQIRQSPRSGSYCSVPCRFRHIQLKAENKPSKDRYGRTWRKADREWRQAVLEAAGYRCQFPGCTDKSSQLDAHHVATRKARPDLKYVVSNGRALHRSCHKWVHDHPREAYSLGLLKNVRYELARREGRLGA